MESQNKRIIKYLQKGKKLTAIDALNKFGCFRLASRINDIKNDYEIKKEWIEKDGKRFVSYSLVK